ncbi:MAG: glyoxalase [Ponticaulis sp.]|nr:glyoxalase [Ponticaulis sp.]|tara:strand:+ start:40860 stop:41243 length:384 start_codon:yes stop_codon:yes gene_type:complete
MTQATLEHVNFTATDPRKTAERLCRVFDWKIRWEGPSLGGGTSVHVGSEDLYLAIYSPKEDVSDQPDSFRTRGGLNHVGVLVSDLEAAEEQVLAEGYETHSHQTYEPGRRFYFHNEDGIEFEVVSYG